MLWGSSFTMPGKRGVNWSRGWLGLCCALVILASCTPHRLSSGNSPATAGIASGASPDGVDDAGPAGADREPTTAAAKKVLQIGVASYYGRRFHGRKTASGEIFDMYALTAAHRTLPWGTIIRVTNIANRRSVEVKVNDRGPYVGDRILDLSYAAARRLGMLEAGAVTVSIEVVGRTD